jgi:hypothetical protein
MNPQPTLKYALVRYQPDRARHEVVNIGTVVFAPLGPLLTLAPNLTKLLAIAPNLSLLAVQDQANELRNAMGVLWRKGIEPQVLVRYFGNATGGIILNELGDVATEGRDVADIVQELHTELVDTPAKTRQSAPRASRLNTELRAMFKSAHILGRTPSDITEHLVVPNYPIDADVGLFAEFALRNGKLRITETVDFRTGDAALKKREAESKTLLLVQALEKLGEKDLHRYVVVSGASAKTTASINLLSRYADDLIVRESAQDWTLYVSEMQKAATSQSKPALH